MDVGHWCFGFSHCDWLGWVQAVKVAGVLLIIVSQSPGVLHPPTPSKAPSISMCQVGRYCVCSPDPNLLTKTSPRQTKTNPQFTDGPHLLLLYISYSSCSPAFMHTGFNWIKIIIWYFVVIFEIKKSFIVMAKKYTVSSLRFYIWGHNKKQGGPEQVLEWGKYNLRWTTSN